MVLWAYMVVYVFLMVLCGTQVFASWFQVFFRCSGPALRILGHICFKMLFRFSLRRALWLKGFWTWGIAFR